MATLAWIVGSGVLMSLIALVGSVTLLVRPAGWLAGGALFHLIPAALAAAPSDDDPQELGDFGVLVHGGWSRKRALLRTRCRGRHSCSADKTPSTGANVVHFAAFLVGPASWSPRRPSIDSRAPRRPLSFLVDVGS